MGKNQKLCDYLNGGQTAPNDKLDIFKSIIFSYNFS